MYSVLAQSISPFAYDQLKESKSISIHSHFKSSMNLLCNDQLIYIGSRALPFGIQISNFNEIRNASSIRLEHKSLYFKVETGEVAVDFSFAPKTNDLHKGILKGANWKIDIIKECVEPKLLEPLMKYLGRGIGLTPSGDDFLVGLYCVSYCDPDLRSQMNELSSINFSEYTTKISSQYLELARKGRFNPDLLLLLETDNQLIFRAILQRIMDIGYSSGVDTLEGILCGLEFRMKNSFI